MFQAHNGIASLLQQMAVSCLAAAIMELGVMINIFTAVKLDAIRDPPAVQ